MARAVGWTAAARWQAPSRSRRLTTPFALSEAACPPRGRMNVISKSDQHDSSIAQSLNKERDERNLLNHKFPNNIILSRTLHV